MTLLSRQKDSDYSQALLAWRDDYVFSTRCPVKIPEVLLENTNLAVINIHRATPNYRGNGGINWAFYDGATKFGATIHLINAQLDAGPIIDCQRVYVGANATVLTDLTVADGSVFGAGTVVTKSIPADTTVAGVSAKRLS